MSGSSLEDLPPPEVNTTPVPTDMTQMLTMMMASIEKLGSRMDTFEKGLTPPAHSTEVEEATVSYTHLTLPTKRIV